MNKLGLLKRLKEIYDHYAADPEIAHARADDALLHFIHDKDITKAYERIPRWYA